MAGIDWQKLQREAENGRGKPFLGEIDITMAEELAFGFCMNPYEAVVIKDKEGRIWFIYETCENDGDFRGLISRYNVRPGMKLRLKVSQEETKVFCITPECEPKAKEDLCHLPT